MTAAEKWKQLDETCPEKVVGVYQVVQGNKVRMAVIPEKAAGHGKPYSVQMHWPGLRPLGGEFETQPKLGE